MLRKKNPILKKNWNPIIFSRSGCLADPCSVVDICGANADCRNEGGRPVCECQSGHKGDPYTGCVRGDCISNSECRDNQACQDYKCVDPCQLSCGSGADCQVNNHVAICRCPRGFTGDPFQVLNIGKKTNKTIPKNERFLHINFDFFIFILELQKIY